MPLILVVTKDDRVPDRVREALGSGGWKVAQVRGVTAAMQEVASEAPDLFLVESGLEGAGNVLASFARRQGGPGTIALESDEGAEPAGGAPGSLPGPTAGLGADAGLLRSFEPAQLRDVVERILQTGDRPPASPAGGPKLTSQDIFGDLVAEVESDAEDFPAPPPRPRGARRGTDDDEIERKLEETLSGVLGRGTRPDRPPSPPRPAPRPEREDQDVEKLISETLSGLELPGARKKKRAEPPPPADPEPPPSGEAPPPKAPGPPARSARGEFGLEDFQALVDRPRKPRRPASGEAEPPSPEAPVPGPPPPEPPPPAPPPEPPPVPGPPAEEPPFRPRFADAMEEVPDEAAVEGAEASAPAGEGAAEPGARFGQYRLLERIGVGGMAEVWKARMTGVEGFQKTVAIKRILPHLTDSSDFVDMFVDEAKLAAQLNHANIIHIYDLGKMGEDYYIAMEYVEGENLRWILERGRETGRPLPVGLALHVAARLASALDHAHRKRDFDDRDLGLVHRDVSPQNVLVGHEGTIKLCDFGIVKAVSKSSHTQRGALKGKLQYMSPEQAWGRTVDGRSDIFSVGALLFEMLTGRRLFVGESEMEVLEAVRECRVVPPSELEPGVSEEVDAVVLEALQRDPDERFQTAGELGRRIEEILGAMRPQPGQAELAAYMAALFDRVPAAAAGEAAAPPPAPSAREDRPPREADGEAPSSGEAEPAEEAVVDPEELAVRPREDTGTGPPTVQAVEPAGRVEPEEGGRRGLWLLVAAILAALVAGGVLAWYFVLGPGEAGEAGEGGTARPPLVAEEVPGEEAEAGGPSGGPGDGEGVEGLDEGLEEGGPVQEPAPGPVEGEGEDGEAGPPEALPQDIEQKLAEREEALRRQFEAELSARERELQERLSELQESEGGDDDPEAASEAPAPAPPPAEPPAEPPATGDAAAEASPGEPAETPEPAVEEVAAPEEPAPPPEEPPPPPEEPPPPPPPPPPAPPPEPQAPPEPAVREGELVTMGPGVTPPKLVRFEKPEYPPIARRLRAEGEVVVSLLVDETGAVTDTRVVQRPSQDVGLVEAALEAARSARYQPATKNGVRVKMWTNLRIPFRL